MRQQQPDRNVVRARLVFMLKQNGEEVTGTAGPLEDPNNPIRQAKVDRDRLTFEVPPTIEDGPAWRFDLQVLVDRMESAGEGIRGSRSLGSTEVVMTRSEQSPSKH